MQKNMKIWFLISLLSFLLTPIASFSALIGKADSAYIQGDYENAFKLYIAESELGNSHAMSMLGWMYATGTIKSQVNNELAFKYFLNAARHGNSYGKINLAVAHANGLGIKKNTDYARDVLNSLDNNDIKTSNVLEPLNKSELLRMLESGNLKRFFTPYIDKYSNADVGLQPPIQQNNSTNQESNVTTQKSKKIDFSIAKKECANLGFRVGTEKFGKCVLELTK